MNNRTLKQPELRFSQDVRYGPIQQFEQLAEYSGERNVSPLKTETFRLQRLSFLTHLCFTNYRQWRQKPHYKSDRYVVHIQLDAPSCPQQGKSQTNH